MQYQDLCNKIIEGVGGKDNVIDVSHCITRLRFRLKDESKADTAALKATKGVLDVIQAAGQYQVVIGATVEAVYADLVQVGGFATQAALDVNEDPELGADGKKTDPFSRLLRLISEIFQPVLGMLMAGAFIQSLLAIATVAGWLDKGSSTYTVLYAIGNAVFYYFPIIIGWSAGKRFGLKPALSMAIGAVLVYPTIVALAGTDPLYTIASGTVFASSVFGDVFGIPLVLQGYASTVIPVIVMEWFASKVYKGFSSVIPALVRSFFSNCLTLAVTGIVGLLVIGPITTILGNLVAYAILAIVSFSPAIAGLVVGTLWSLLVMFGLHWAVIPLWFVDVATYGYDVINPLVFAGAPAILGACLGMIVRSKNAEENSSINVPSAISAFFGVCEPALYGILIPRKKLMWATFLSAGVGGAIAGIAGAKLYSFGANGFLGAPNFIDPSAGINGSFIGLIVGGVIALVAAFVAALILGGKKDESKVMNIEIS